MNIDQLYSIYKDNPSVQTDTRKLQRGDLFFALKGPSFNGNQFALKALEIGAAWSVIDEDIPSTDKRLIRVADALATLQELAKYHRSQFSNRKIPFIAITGSNGKTTTKELVSAVLSSHYKTYTTKGNLNNHIGIPLTLLSVREDAEMAVIEMGANHLGEIKDYCSYTLPTHGVITNCGKAHLEGFGSMEGVRKGKGELFDFLRANNGTAFINTDEKYFEDMSKNIAHVIGYGTDKGEVTGVVKTSDPFLELRMKSGMGLSLIQTHLVGQYNLPNVLCALAFGKYFNVPEEKIKKAIEDYFPSNSRSQLIEKDGNQVIMDAYNANPSSMVAAIENFGDLIAENKIVILGAMMELGESSIAEHEALIALLQKYKWNKVILVGGDFGKITHPYIYLKTSEDAKKWFQQAHLKGAHLLIKGSRSMQMEKVLEA